MKHKRKILSLVLIFALLASTLTLFSCAEVEKISFEYTLSEADYTAFEEKLESFSSLALADAGILRLIRPMSELNDSMNHIMHQRLISEVLYYMDLSSTEAYDNFVRADELYFKMRKSFLAFAKELYNSETQFKDTFFGDWGEDEINALLSDSDKTNTLAQASNEIIREFNSLTLTPGSEEWSNTVNSLYFDLVANYQETAQLMGYENYYEYASSVVYKRSYTEQERDEFRSYVASYIIPLCDMAETKYYDTKATLTDAEKAIFDGLRMGKCDASNAYITGYVNSFTERSMRDKMNALLSGEAALYSTSENALEGAFVTYSPKYMAPMAFFGKGYQDLLSVTHEMGHFVSYYHFDSTNLPIDTAEVHSQGNVWLLISHLESVLDSKVYEALYSYQLYQSLRTVIYATIVDDYEERIYTAEEPYLPEDYSGVMDEVLSDYPGLENLNIVTPFFEYAQHVTIPQAVYYISYATSEIAAEGFYIIAKEEGYQRAQDIYTVLQEEAELGVPFRDTLDEVSLYSPFVRETYEKLYRAFAGKDAPSAEPVA